MRPESARNENLGLDPPGPPGLLDEPDRDHVGHPLAGDPNHVAYVWFDALLNYCTAIGYGEDRAMLRSSWPVDYHLIGKDILRQHAV